MPRDATVAPASKPHKQHAARKARGARSHAQGLSAEAQVIRTYQDRGARLLHHRWRGAAGEIDLVFSRGIGVVCVEVKSSRSHADAALHLGPRQQARLMAAAEEFAGTQPRGSLTPLQLDVALVDQLGRIDVIENALMGA